MSKHGGSAPSEDAFEGDASELWAVAALFDAYPRPWGVCGGWAIDLFLRRSTRPHGDVDVAVLRGDQHAVRSHLETQGFTLEVAHQGVVRPWSRDETLALPFHGIWCRRETPEPTFVELLLNDSNEQEVLFRRDPSVRLPLAAAFVVVGPGGVPCLAPEMVLLYKATTGESRGIEEADFRAALPALGGERAAWLLGSLARVRVDHPWCRALAEMYPTTARG